MAEKSFLLNDGGRDLQRGVSMTVFYHLHAADHKVQLVLRRIDIPERWLVPGLATLQAGPRR